jgi:hypothetical protein
MKCQFDLTRAARQFNARKIRGPGLGTVLSSLLALPRPDPAAELLAALGVDARAARERFAELDQDGRQ